MGQVVVEGGIRSIIRLRAWKLALSGPTVYWYFPIFFVLLSTHQSVSPIGLTALFFALMLTASWGFLINDLFDREADAKAGRVDASHGHGLSKSSMWMLVLSTAILSWVIVFLIGGGLVFKLPLAIDYIVATMYSATPMKLKVRGFWGFLANSLIERPLFILVFLFYMNYFTYETVLLPVLMELTWSVFKHQAADVKEDAAGNVKTFAVSLGEKISMKIVNLFLNPLSFLSLLLLVVISWIGIPELRLELLACFAFILIGGIAAVVAERAGKITKYITPTDPPYIIFLNLAYRFVLLPILALGILVYNVSYFPLVVLLVLTLSYHAVAYGKLAKYVLS